MPETSDFTGFARVEVMGHVSHCGFVTTQAFGAAVLFRVDRPEIAEREITLTKSGWVDNRHCPAGTVVKRPKIKAATVLIGAGSIYRIIPCTEEAALLAIEQNEARPLILVSVPESAQLPAGESKPKAWDEDPDDEEDDDPFDDMISANARV
jgi:hypothetical protein